MTTYETIFITVPILTEQEEQELVSGWVGVVTEAGGNLVANERMGRRRLAYPIQKFEDGVYTRFLYDAEAEIPRELERRFRLSDKVLRHLTVRLEPDWADAAKEQAVRDAQARAEAARRREAEEQERAAAAEQAAAQSAADVEAADPTTDAGPEPSAAQTTEPAAEGETVATKEED